MEETIKRICRGNGKLAGTRRTVALTNDLAEESSAQDASTEELAADLAEEVLDGEHAASHALPAGLRRLLQTSADGLLPPHLRATSTALLHLLLGVDDPQTRLAVTRTSFLPGAETAA